MYHPRHWLAAIACTLALVAPARAIDPNHLPADSELILTINVQQILKSDLAKNNKDVVAQLKFLAENQLADLGAMRYLEKLDLDLFRDVTTVTVATNGGRMPHFILLEGKFNAEKFNAVAEEVSRDKDNAAHIKPIKIGSQQAFEVRISSDDKPMFAGVLGKDRLIAAGSKEAFTDAIARIGSTTVKPSKLKKELRDLLGPAAARQSLSLVTTGPALAKFLDDAPVPNVDALQDLMADLSALNISISVEKNVAFEFAVHSNDKKTAGDMAKLSGVVLAASRIQLKKDAEANPKLNPVLDIVNTMRATSQGTNFVLRGEIAADTLAKLIKDLPK